MQKGTSHSDFTKAKIAEGVRLARARAQVRRERSSLTVVAIDDALAALEDADVKIAKVRRLKFFVEGSYEHREYVEAERATETAIAALATASYLIRNFDPTPQEQPA